MYNGKWTLYEGGYLYVSKIAKECLAGFTVAIVALPLAIAFGIAATGTSEGALVGLYGAIFAGLFARYLAGHLDK